MLKAILTALVVATSAGIAIYYLGSQRIVLESTIGILLQRQINEQAILADKAFDVAAASNGVAISGWQYYHNERYGFDVRIPQGWSAVEGENRITGGVGQPAVVLLSPEVSTSTQQINIFKGLEKQALLSGDCGSVSSDYAMINNNVLYKEVCVGDFQLLISDKNPGKSEDQDLLDAIADTFTSSSSTNAQN